MIAAVISRLEARVSDLGGRVEGALDFSELMRSGNLPHHTPAAHVIPLGLQGRAAEASTGVFKEAFNETVGVILTLRGNTPSGQRALESVRDLIFDVITAICGWAPANQSGVFTLARASLVSMTRGTLVYQIDFTIEDQLRITP